MSTLHILLICLLVSLVRLDCPNQNITINRSSTICKFQFLNLGLCDKTLFINCKIAVNCSTPENCADQTREFNFGACMSVCCNGVIPNFDNKYDNVKECLNVAAKIDKENSQIHSLFIFMAIILGIIFFSLGFGYFILKKCRKSTTIDIIESNNELRYPTNPEATKVNSIKQQNSVTNLLFNCQWKDSSRTGNELPDCTICLSQNANMQLQCGHSFHPLCFRQWIKKKRQCGVCRGSNIRCFKILCSKCNKKQTVLNICQLGQSKKNAGWLDCSSCR